MRLTNLRFRALILLLAGCVFVCATPHLAAQATADSITNDVQSYFTSLNNAYKFLDFMMDAYQQGSTPRLIQSYGDGPGFCSCTAFTYDNDVAVMAYLARGTTDDLARAQVMGNAILFAQQHDPYHDGRVREAYWPTSIAAPNGVDPSIGGLYYLPDSRTGEQAWTGMALAQLYVRTHNADYLNGAASLGAWIVNNTLDTRVAGGYNSGKDTNNNAAPYMYKSTENNIDAYALFVMLDQLHASTGTLTQPWSYYARQAVGFLQAMWNPTSSTTGFFWTGTDNSGVTPNASIIPEDVQTWSFLALHDRRYSSSIDWALKNLATTDTSSSPNNGLSQYGTNLSISGLSFDTFALSGQRTVNWDPRLPDPNSVWLEGTAHTADALLFRGGFDFFTAAKLLGNVEKSQQVIAAAEQVNGQPIPLGLGIAAATSTQDTGFYFDYYQDLHVGATAWYLTAGQFANPFKLGLR